jgi:hypothetical protein
MSPRTPLSKRTRFEILKRDGFRCVYCGATPMDQPLHVDHVLAVANGGSDDPANLVASCEPCNLGKSAVPLGEKRYAPTIATEAQEEHAEQIKKYLALQRKIANAKRAVAEELERYWIKRLGAISRTMQTRLAALTKEYSLTDLMGVVDIVAARDISGVLGQAQYFYGVLRRMKREAAGE